MPISLPEKIETPRLLIQKLRYEDAEEIFYTYASKAEATRFVSWETHRKIEDTTEFLRYATGAWKSGKDFSYSVRLKLSNRLIGSIGIINSSGDLQFGYIFTPTQWNQGYATETCRALLSHLTKDPGVKRISTFVDAENVASARVLLKCGLIEEARLSAWFPFPNQKGVRKDCLVFKYPENR
jgi:[ribosomal protein S5]-alanine N-acetyltransferase